MTTNYPSGLDSFTRPTPGQSKAGGVGQETVILDNLSDAVEAIQAELGTNPAGSEDTVGTRVGLMETSVAAGVAPALVPLASALKAGLDASVVLIGDSTGNGTNEWFYLWGQWLATQFPAYTVEHRLVNSYVYQRPTYIQTGPSGVRSVSLAGTLNDLTQLASPTGLSAGDLDLRVYMAATDWTPAALGLILSRFGGGGDRLLRFGLGSSGALTFDWTTDGTTIQTVAVSSAATGFTDGTAHWVRVTLDVDNGGGQHEIKFYTSDTGTSWTQLGTTTTRAGVTSIYTGGSGLWELGGRGGSGELLAGTWYEAEVRNGIGDSFPLVVGPLPSSWYGAGSNTPETRNGSPCLTLWNGSISGASVTGGSFTGYISSLIPPGSHSIVLVSTGHNEGFVQGPAWVNAFGTFADAVAARVRAPVVGVTQNPKTSPQSDLLIHAHAQRVAGLAAWSSSGAGRGLLNAYQAFLDDGRAVAGTLVDTDGTHPTQDGFQLWADTFISATLPALP